MERSLGHGTSSFPRDTFLFHRARVKPHMEKSNVISWDCTLKVRIES